jgi:hypothetical protein
MASPFRECHFQFQKSFAATASDQQKMGPKKWMFLKKHNNNMEE